jgi:phosphoribosyl 1,2-cyclic phosphodiesterase
LISFTSFASSSKGNLYSVSNGDTTIMIDCGVPWGQIQKAFGFQTSRVSALCLDHEHKDHSRSVIDVAKAGIDVFLLPETRVALGVSGHRFHDIAVLEPFKIGTFTIKAFGLQHDVPNCGFLFASGTDRAVFLIDTAYCQYRFNSLSVIAIEANFSKRTLAPDLDPAVKRRLYLNHFSLENVKKFLQANDLTRVREIHLLHLSAGNSDAALFRAEIEKLTGKPTYIAEE